MASQRSAALGEIIRQQRALTAMSMRQVAERAGISNPYLSQIERGLRAPSDQVLGSIAKTLNVSPRSLYEQAGIPPRHEQLNHPMVLDAIAHDSRLTPRQRAALREIYEAFVASAPTNGRLRR